MKPHQPNPPNRARERADPSPARQQGDPSRGVRLLTRAALVRSLTRAVPCALLLASASAAAQGRPPPAAGPKAPKVTKDPKLGKFVEAPYPDEEKAVGRAASGTLEIAVSETGAVVDAQVVGSAGAAFDAAALAAVKQFV